MTNEINVLVYGSGAREHALAQKISQSKLLNKLYLALPNDGFSHLGEVIKFSDYNDLAKKCRDKNINTAIIGPEEPLVNGITNNFESYDIKTFGVNKKFAQLEGSKSFAKEFMQKNSINTANYIVISNKNAIDTALKSFSPPYVIKADGLAAGKGVFIAKAKEEARIIINEYLDGKFGESSKKVLIEQFIKGEELSLMSIFDGKTLLPFITAKDYKKLENNDKGPNTGGMGSFCPVKLEPEQEKNLNEYIKKLETALIKEKADFRGVIYSGLIQNEAGLNVLEFNVRFGDPEIQSLLCHLESDFLEVINATLKQELHKIQLKWKKGTSGCVVIASKGYPYGSKKGCEINNLNKLNCEVFFAGVKKENDKLISNGGRALSLCYTSDNPFDKIYKEINKIDFQDAIYRTDIGE